MNINMNFHSHTNFCDGKETAEEMVQAAVEKGFTALGFSGHSYTWFDESYCMSKAGVLAYQEEIARLQKVYQEQIRLYCGVEQDFYSDEPTTGFAYAIGSVHYIKKDNRFLCVDETAERTTENIRESFGGNPYAYAQAYFETVGRVLERTDADIIGHFDLITKFNEDNRFFDTTDRRYQKYGMEAIAALLPYDRPFEINTGAIYRGLRTMPYPAVAFLCEIQKRGGKILLSSDSHDGASLGFYFNEVIALAKELGFSSTMVWTPTGFTEIGLR